MIDSLADYLQDNGFGTVATDIFIDELPLDIPDCIAVINSTSPTPDKAIPYYTQNVDIWARYTSHAQGRLKLQDIMDNLHQKEHYTIDGFLVYLSYANGMIESMGVDSQRRHLFKLSIGFVYREANLS